MSENQTDTQAALDAGRELADIGTRYALIGPDENDADNVVPIGLVTQGGNSSIVVLKDVLATADARADAPRRRIGGHVVTELDSFVALVNRFKSDQTVVWADVDAFKVTAVFNEHLKGPLPGDAGWRDHRAVYQCPRSPEWVAWTAVDGKTMGQDAFAEWIEQRLEDLRAGDGFPAPTDVLKVARDLQVNSKGTFSRAFDPTTGTGHLVCKTDNESSSTPIPRAFLLAIPVFIGGERYQVEARIRFAMVEGRPTFTVVLHRRVEIERDAFADVRKAVVEGCDVPLFAGSPG